MLLFTTLYSEGRHQFTYSANVPEVGTDDGRHFRILSITSENIETRSIIRNPNLLPREMQGRMWDVGSVFNYPKYYKGTFTDGKMIYRINRMVETNPHSKYDYNSPSDSHSNGGVKPSPFSPMS